IPADIAATLLYPVTDRPFRELYEMTCEWSAGRRAEVIDVALGSRTRRDEILAGFRGGPYAYDFVIDIGAYRDLHRHRRCQKFRQAYAGKLGYDTPKLVTEAGAEGIYDSAMRAAFECMRSLPAPGAEYILPFGARSRFLFKMDFAEPEKPGKVEARAGVLSIDVPAGCTLWFRPILNGAVMIEYEARMVQAGGPNDRVSDLNAFWMAQDSRSPDDLFATRRSGKFS